MDFRRFLPDMKNWTLGEMACAAGLLALSAGAGYCVYRGLHRRSAPTPHVQPVQDPVDVLEEPSNAPSFHQVIELNQLLLPTEPHQEPPAVDLRLGGGELNSASSHQCVGADGREDTSTWTQGHCHCSQDGDSESEPDFEEDNLTPEEKEVPFICSHLADKGITEVGSKLCPLRQAFSTLFTSIHKQNYFFVVGKKIVMRLAAANKQDVVGVQLAYESLIRFLRQPSNQHLIEAELPGARLQHYNFFDVFFELLLFGYLTKGVAPEAREGGFLERLFSLIGMWDVDEWEPAAERYLTELIDQLTALSEVLFCQPLELYRDPAALASAISGLVCQHVQQMMDTLERL